MIAVYAKNMEARNGNKWVKYIARLNRKDGSAEVVDVKFTKGCDAPAKQDCPRNIEATVCNMSQKHYTKNDGTAGLRKILWIDAYVDHGKSEDHSLDEYVM